MIFLFRNLKKTWPGFIWILAASFLLAYSLLTVIPLQSERGFFYNLQAIEDGRYAWIFALLLMFIPAWRVYQKGFLLFCIPLCASFLLSWPLIQSSRLIQTIPQKFPKAQPNPFSFIHWISAESPSMPFENIQNDGDTLRALHYRNSAENPKALIILLHGGGFYQGSPEWMHNYASALVIKGFDVISPTYPLEPDAHYPHSSQVLLSHLDRWINKLYPLENQRPPLFFAGSSAGGTMAMNTASLSKNSVAGIIVLYPISDFSTPFASISDISRINNAYVLKDSDGLASPILQQKNIPLLIFHGSMDLIIPVEQSRKMNLASNFSPKYYFELPWATHNFEYPIYGPSAQFSLEATEAFILETLTNSAQ